MPVKKVAPETEERHHASYVPRWSLAERDRRWALIRERMVVEGIDGLLMVGTDVKWGIGLANVRYVSHIGSSSGVYVYFPLVGEPVVWTERPHQFFPSSRYLFTQDWVRDIRPDAGPKPIVDFLKERKLDRSTIGLVGYTGTVLAGMDIIPATFTEYLYKELPNVNWVKATGLVNHVRVIKSAEEISYLEKAAGIARKMIDKMIESAEPGKKECELYADMIRMQLASGGEAQIFLMMSSGPVEGPGDMKQLLHGQHQPTVPTTRTLQKGDLIIFEMHASYGGYLAAAEFSLFLGKAPAQLRRIHDVCLECADAVEQAMKPGATFREVLEAERAPCLKAGMDYLELGFHQHDLGSAGPLTVVHKTPGQPDGGVKSGILVQENMVFGTNIDIHDPDWKKDVGLVFGDLLHVTKNGARRLVHTPTGIFEKPV